MTITVKVCGLSTPEAIATAHQSGAAFLGFIHYPKSPRHVSLETAASLFHSNVKNVVVCVDPDDALIDQIAIIRPDYIQLHGSETPERVARIKARANIPLIKSIPVDDATDIAQATLFTPHVDYLLFDAKPKPEDTLPGGNSRCFNWTLLQGLTLEVPWFLSGGLDADNLQQAVEESGAHFVDVSSGVEAARGVKDEQRIAQFLTTANAL